MGDDHEAAARTLGATRWQAFRHVLLPMLMPALAAASALVFAFAFGAYEVPLILGVHAPEGAARSCLAGMDRHRPCDPARGDGNGQIIALIGIGLLLLYARLLGLRDAH